MPAPAGPRAPVNMAALAPPKRAEVPLDYSKLVAQADRLSENGRAAQARKLYEKALELRPQGAEALTGIGYCDLDAERFLAAIERFKQTLVVAPDYGEALIGLAEAYKVRGDRPHAVEYYRRYLKAQPGGPKASMAQKNVRELEAAPKGPERDEPEPAAAGDGQKQLPRPPPVTEE
jgi:tetratricopeptide (TPR) repeat protein